MARTGGIEKGDAAERLLNITLALLTSRNGLTKAELFQAVRDYRTSIEQGTSADALEKKFDRDKNDLRANGIQLETFILQSDGDDNQQTRYIINASEFSWPKDIRLSSKQLQLLNLAAQVWRQASLSSDATAGLDRLRALGVSGEPADLVGYAPRIKTHEPSFIPLTNAVSERAEVSFNYRKPGQDGISKRTVQPWQLKNISGQWLLVCWDSEAQDVRNFMLKRIVGAVKATGQTFDLPPKAQLEVANADLEAHIEKQIATLLIKRDSMAWFHFEVSGTADEAEISFNYMDKWLLAEELRDYAGDFEVIGPRDLAEAIREGFERVAAEHG